MIETRGTPAFRSTEQPSPSRRYMLVGGFPGAGKTTALSRLASWLGTRGLKVGIITNDHGSDLVDTVNYRAQGFLTEEIRGGCFASRFDSLTEASERLMESQPDVLLVEAAGSCADLRATVTHPLRRFGEARFSVAPLSVMIDPVCASRFLDLEQRANFSETIQYIYRKQLEEADLIVINKCDLVDRDMISRLRHTLGGLFPEATVMEVSARKEHGLEEWFESLMSREQAHRRGIELDYDLYAQAEARLGWLNCTVRISTVKYFDGGKLLLDLAACIQSLLQQERGEVAHLKMALSPDDGVTGLAVLSLARNDGVAELAQELPEPIQSGTLLLNLRAEADPEVLHAVVNRALLTVMEKWPELFARMEQCEHFRPAQRQPTHRIAQVN